MLLLAVQKVFYHGNLCCSIGFVIGKSAYLSFTDKPINVLVAKPDHGCLFRLLSLLFLRALPVLFSRRMPLFLRGAEEPLPRWDYLLANSPSGLQLSRRYSSLRRECVQLLFSKNRDPQKNISEIVF